MRRNYFSRMMAVSLSVIITISNVNLMAFAGDSEEKAAKVITNIEKLDDYIEYQSLFAGASYDEIIFPDSLKATVTYTEEKEVEKKVEPQKDPAEGEKKETDQDSETEQDQDGLEPSNTDPASTDPTAPDAPSQNPPEGNSPAGDTPAQNPQEGDTPAGDIQSQNPPAGDTPAQDPPADNQPEPANAEPANAEPANTEPANTEPANTEPENPAPADPGPQENTTGGDNSLIGRLIPALKVYAADEPGLDKYSEPDEIKDETTEVYKEKDQEEVKEQKDQEEQYETVIETVTVTEDIVLEGITWKLDKENSSFDKFRSDEAGAEFIFVPVISDEYEIKAEVPTITVSIEEPLFLRTMMLRSAPPGYDIEHADGKSFSQTVRVNFSDASLLTAGESYVVLRLVGNTSGKNVRKSDLEITSEPFTILESDHIVINGITDDGEGNTTAYVEYTFNNIPIYVNKGTGDAMAGGSGTYEVPDSFYGIQITTADGYSVDKGAIDSASYYNMSLAKDINDAAWTTPRIIIENKMLQLVKPSFTVEWQDNRNYADLRPFSAGTSIEGNENEIKQGIELYYKDGNDYVLVSDTSPILVSPGSNHPEVEGGPFNWKFSYKNLPRYQSGETAYQWYIKLSDAFYDGNKAYYNISGLNEDGYLNISESGTDSVSLFFTDGVTGSIVWRVGSEETQVIPALPASGLFTTSENTMRLFSKEGEEEAVEITSPDLNVEWSKSADGKTWDYKIIGLPNYAADGDAIIYYTVIDSTANSNFKFTYDNGKDSTETDKCLTGQKIYGTIIGDAQFSFDKVWYDDKDDDSRDRRSLAISKGITFYLWRYPSNGTLADGAPVTNNAKQYSYTLTADRAQQDSFTISLADFAGSSTATFPRYDELGYTYKYYATEVSKSELYKTVYWNSQQDFTGESTDKCVYNGGKVCNVRSAMIAPSVTKQWTVSAISDYVGSTCSFTLQRKERDTWVDKGTLTLSGFSSSKKKVSGTFEANQLYDSYGKRYEYRVIETNVRSGSGVDLVFEQEDWEESADGKFSRVYTLNDYTYKAVSDYKSTVENGVESAQAIVTNKLYGTKKLTIIKNWTGASWGIGTGDDKTGTITISLKRDNDSGLSSKYATITLNKSENSTTSGSVTVRYEEDDLQKNYSYQISDDGKTWTTDEIIVPAYTDEGRQYIYSIVEESVETQDVTFYQEYDRNITGKNIKLYVTNRIGTTSTDTRIDVRKIWKDDSDSSQRSNVKIEFGIYDSNNVFQPVRNAQGEPYVLILTPERDYNHYTFVNGDYFKADESESREDAIKNHLSIRASLYNPETGDYDREMENCTYSNGTVTGTISPIVDKANNFYRPGYNVTIERNTNGTSFVITNTRIAKRDFSFTKNWEDSANALKLRKDFLRVALFREVNDVEQEIAYIDIPTYKDAEKTQLSSGSDLTVNFNKGGEHYPAYDEDGNNYIYSVKEYICEGTPSSGETQCAHGVEQDSQATSRTEVSLTATKETTTTGYVVTRENGNTEYALDAANNVMLMTESYTYTNMAAGERGEVPFYVVWHDSAKSSERPDIYLTLYYDGGENGELIPYTGSYTERWEHVEAGNKFIQKAIFSGLPSADPNGRVYTYYVTETFNNATSHYGTEHYLTPFRNSTDNGYNLSAVEPKTIGQDHQLIVKDALAAEKDTVQVGDRYFIKEESFGLISISDVIKIEGRKLWLGIPDGIDVDKLPKAHIYLFRTSAYDDSNKAPEVAASAPKETKMETYRASSVKEISPQDGSKSPQQLNETKSMFVFGTYNPDGTVKSYAEFPKYDKMGYLYTYSVREVIYNTLTNENELPADIMLPIYSDNSTDLSNQYKLEANKNKREFIVYKQWSIKRSKFQNVDAKATFRLYRMELESDGNGYEPLHYAENDSDASEVSSSAAAANLFSLTNNKLELLDEKTIPSNVSSITWDNYPIFAPSGKLYAYYAVELTADMPGYTISLNGSAPSNETAQGSGPAANNTMVSGGTIEGGDRYIGVAFANSNISLAYTSEQNKKEETFRNTYEPTGFKSITFTKKWEAKDSQGNLIASMIPGTGDTTPALKFDVYAIANTQSGKGNPDRINISEDDYEITVAPASGDPSTWNYTITLKNNDVAPIYSANGNLYTYYVKEKLNSPFVNANYKTVTAVTYAKANTAQGDVLNLPNPLKNTLKGTFEVQKIWDDFSNDYGMREGSIAFDVYYCLGENGTWAKYKNESYLLSTGNKWKTSISGLPVCSNKDGAIGEYYQYRIWEKKISSADGDVPVAEPAENDPQTTKWKKNNTEITDADNYFTAISAGNYMVYNPSDMASITGSPSKKIVNQLNTNDAVVSLKVIKKWEDDNNKYGLRPGSIKVTIQSSKNGGTIWSDVTTRDITSSQATSGNANIWEKTFDNLPKFYGNSTEAKYMYRAVETKIGSTDTTLNSLTGSGGSYEIVHVHGTSDSGFTSDITNTIVKMDNSIHVEKRWNSQTPLSDVEVALFSTNYTGGTASTGTPVLISFDTNRQVLSTANSWTYTYSDLPRYNKDRAPIYYYVKEITTGSFKTQYLEGNGSWPSGSCDDALKYTSGNAQSDFYVIIVNTPLTSISGSKKWEDEGNKFKLRPDSVSLTLQRKAADSDEPWTNVAGYEAVTLNAANSWTKTIDKLPLYELSDGSQAAVKYQYRLAELSSVNGYTRNPDKADIALTPEDGYEYGGTDMAQKSAVTNYLVRRKEPVTVKKIWNTDIDNQKNPVTVKLLSRNFTSGTDDGVSALSPVTGTGVSFERELNAANQWEIKYENLPLKNKTENEIVYYISETLDATYDTEYFIYNGSSFVKVLEKDVKASTDAALLAQIINTPFTTASVEKKWSDNDNKFGTRPDNIYVRLQRKALDEQNWSYVEGQQVLTLNAANSWKSTIDTLPLFKEYSEEGPVRYEYRFIETDLSGNPYVPLGYTLVPDSSEYVKTTDGSEAGYVNNFSDGKYSTVITNTLITKTVTVVKYWEDDSDAHKIRPYEITIYLDENDDYVRFDGNRCSNMSMEITPTKSSDSNTWTYVFAGLPKYGYGQGSSPSHPSEIVYEATEDVDKVYTGGFVIKNYYVTNYEVSGDETRITNTAMENDGCLIIGKRIELASELTSYAFPFNVKFTRPDGNKVDYVGGYYLYDASISDADLRLDAVNEDSTTDRIKLQTSNGVIRIPAGKVAVLTGINTMYQYTITESPNHAAYSVEAISGADTKEVGVLDTENGGYIGIARGHVPGMESAPVRVVFTNKLFDYSNDHKYLKVENITKAETDKNGNEITGGQVKVYQSNKVVDNSGDIGRGSYEYMNVETPYIERAMSVEFEPDSANGYSYADTLTINWWQSGDDTSAAAPHSIDISGYFYTDSTGRQRPYTGKLSKDSSGNITVESEFERFESVWAPLLNMDGSPFKHLTVLEGSVVVTLASNADDMPLKTLVQVEFVPPAKSSANPSGQGSSEDGGSGNSSSDNSNSSESGKTKLVALSDDGDDKQKNQADKEGNYLGVRTGDDTPISMLLVLFIFFTLGFAAVCGKYLRSKPKKR